MKKFLSFLCVCLAIIPVIVFAGCNKKQSAKDVRGHKYTISTAMRFEDSLDAVIENNLRITFYDNTFSVEYGKNESDSNYGRYLGTYTTKGNIVNFTTTEKSGTFAESIPTYLNFTSIQFVNGKLVFEDIINDGSNSYIYRFVFVKVN